MGEQHNIAIKCPQCGGEVSQEDAKDGICTCPYCKNVFYIDDIIKQPKINVTHNTTTNTYYMGNMKPDDIKLNIGGQDIRFENPLNILKSDRNYDDEDDYWLDKDGNKHYTKNELPPWTKVIIGGMLLFMILLFGGIYLQTGLEYKKYNNSSAEPATEAATGTEKVDLSNILQIEFAEGSSYVDGEASIQYRWLDDRYSDIQLKARPKENLGTGDVVHISVDDLGSHSEDEFKNLEWDWTFNLMTFEKME